MALTRINSSIISSSVSQTSLTKRSERSGKRLYMMLSMALLLHHKEEMLMIQQAKVVTSMVVKATDKL
jgi:hypothetical protein